MKNFLKKIWKAVKKAYYRLVDETRQWVPVAVQVVEGIKMVMDGPVDDVVLSIIKKAIPGNADDVVIDKIKRTVEEWLPRVLFELKLINSIANIDDPNEQLKAIIAELKLSSDETKSIVYQGLATLILEKLADGKLTWSEAGVITEYYYQNTFKNQLN